MLPSLSIMHLITGCQVVKAVVLNIRLLTWILFYAGKYPNILKSVQPFVLGVFNFHSFSFYYSASVVYAAVIVYGRGPLVFVLWRMSELNPKQLYNPKCLRDHLEPKSVNYLKKLSVFFFILCLFYVCDMLLFHFFVLSFS